MKLLLLALLFPLPLSAICLAPAGHDLLIARTEAAILHRAATDKPGYQEMILRITPVFEAEPAASLAWIVPLPSVPIFHNIADDTALYAGAEMHTRLYGLARDQWARRTEYKWPQALSWMQRRESAQDEPSALQMPALEPAAAPAIHVAADTAELRRWLTQHGFATPDLGRLEQQGMHYLCVLVTPRDGRPLLGQAVELSPIHVAFESESVFVPVVVGEGQPQGAIDLAFISDRPLSIWPYEFLRDGLRARSAGYVNLFNLWSIQPLSPELAVALSPRATAPAERWYANRIESSGLPAADGAARAEWSIEIGGLEDELPGFWYYADQDISFMERFFREHLLAVTTSFFLLFVLFLVLKGRQRRRELEQHANAVTRRTAP